MPSPIPCPCCGRPSMHLECNSLEEGLLCREHCVRAARADRQAAAKGKPRPGFRRGERVRKGMTVIAPDEAA